MIKIYTTTILVISLLVGGIWLLSAEPNGSPLGGEGVVKVIKEKTKEEKYKDLIASSSIDVEVKKLKTKEEKVELKSYAIKDKTILGKFEYRDNRGGVSFGAVSPEYEIEILSVEVIDGGIEVYARAWKDNLPVGFGKDGTVEIERFKIYNPPVLVEDSRGRVVRTSVNTLTGEVHSRYLKEDASAALQESLGHTIGIVGKNGDNVIQGRVGNTTSTFYPDAGSGSGTTVDGLLYRNGPNGTWASHRGATTASGALDTSAFQWGTALGTISSTPTDNWYYFYRSMFNFDTSPIPDGDTLSSGTFSLSGNSKQDTGGWGLDFSVIDADPTTDNALATSDFDNTTFTRMASDITYSSFSTTGYNDWTLNASGLSNIDKAGVSGFAHVSSADADNTPPTWSKAYLWGNDIDYADTTGTANDPKLVIEHSAGGGGDTGEEYIIIFSFKTEDMVEFKV